MQSFYMDKRNKQAWLFAILLFKVEAKRGKKQTEREKKRKILLERCKKIDNVDSLSDDKLR